MITVDSAEPAEIKDKLVELYPDTIIQAIPIGDYYISGEQKEVLLTRKSYGDMIKSARSSHLWQELKRMSESDIEAQALILEGDPSQIYEYGHATLPEVIGIISAVALDWQLPIIPTKNPLTTATTIGQINKRLGKGDRVRHFRTRHLPKISDEDRPIAIIQGIRGVGGAKAEALLEKFGTPLDVFEAEVEELKEVDGIGKKMAELIHDSVRQRWEKPKA